MKIKILLTVIIITTLSFLAQAQTAAKTFRGYVSGKRIQMTLTRDGDKLSGTYFYTKYGTDLKLAGTIDAQGNIKLAEFDPKGVKTGEFTGTWKQDESGGVALEGEWKKTGGKDTTYFSADEQMINFTNGAKLITKTVAETNKPKRFEISAEIPEITGIDAGVAAKFNQLVKNRVMKTVNEFRKGMLEQTAEDLKYLPKDINNYIEISYDVEAANNDFISLSFGDSEFTGGAHPNHASFTVNYDLKNNRELKLADLFKPNANYLKVISDYAINDLKKQLTDMSDDEWIKTGAGATTENYQSWNITDKSLLINFDPYQVAAYAAGSQEVLIPYSALKSILRDNSVVSGL